MQLAPSRAKNDIRPTPGSVPTESTVLEVVLNSLAQRFGNLALVFILDQKIARCIMAQITMLAQTGDAVVLRQHTQIVSVHEVGFLTETLNECVEHHVREIFAVVVEVI